jgi:hypothetical protein
MLGCAKGTACESSIADVPNVSTTVAKVEITILTTVKKTLPVKKSLPDCRRSKQAVHEIPSKEQAKNFSC